MILTCDFFTDGNYIITSTLDGDVNLHSVKDDLGIVKHETITQPNHKTNIAYCARYIKESKEPYRFIVGSENK
jgi:hypothetical protein